MNIGPLPFTPLNERLDNLVINKLTQHFQAFNDDKVVLKWLQYIEFKYPTFNLMLNKFIWSDSDESFLLKEKEEQLLW